MVASAVFVILVVVLATISNQAASIWSRNESKSEVREAARAAVSRMSAEMKQATLPLDKADQESLQFVINPAGLTTPHGNSVFWQAPIATSRTKGDLAIVGYFVRRDTEGGKPVSRLCRVFVNPDDPNYAMGGSWITDGLLTTNAPGTEASDFKGLFLENVLGMWVTAYSDATTPYSPAYDSRNTNQLPTRVEVTLAILDKKAADRATTLPSASGSSDVVSFISNLPDPLKPHVQAVTINAIFPQ